MAKCGCGHSPENCTCKPSCKCGCTMRKAWKFLKLGGVGKRCDPCDTTFGNVEEDTCRFCGGELREVRG